MELTKSSGRTPPSLATLVLLSGLGASVMNVFMAALPDMARDFSVNYDQVQLAITAYLVGTAIAQLLIGPFSDRYGRRPIVLTCLSIFSIASLGCALAQDFGVFMTFRMMQCFVVACLVVSRAAVRDMVAGEKAASMIAYVTMGMSLVPMIAPTFGGFVDQYFGWRTIFVVLAFVGVFGLMLVYFDFGETKLNRETSIVAQFKRYPDLISSRRFWGYTLILAFASGMFFSYLSGGPFLGDHLYHLEGGALGAYLGAAPFGYFFGNWISGRFAQQLGVQRLILIGLAVSIGGMVVAILPALLGATHPIWFFGFTVFIGLGNGMTNPSANAGLLEARPDLAGSASGLSGAILMFGGAGLAQIGGMLLTKFPSPLILIAVILFSGILALIAAIVTFRVEAKVKSQEAPSHAQG